MSTQCLTETTIPPFGNIINSEKSGSSIVPIRLLECSVKKLDEGQSLLKFGNGIETTVSLDVDRLNTALFCLEDPSLLIPQGCAENGRTGELRSLFTHSVKGILDQPVMIATDSSEFIDLYLKERADLLGTSPSELGGQIVANSLLLIDSFLDAKEKLDIDATLGLGWLKRFTKDYTNLYKVCNSDPKGIEVNFQIDPALIRKQYSPEFLLHIFEVIRNGFKNKAHRIDVSFTQHMLMDRLCEAIRIRDDGIGIPDIKDAFESGRSTTGSTGVGLNLFRSEMSARKIIFSVTSKEGSYCFFPNTPELIPDKIKIQNPQYPGTQYDLLIA